MRVVREVSPLAPLSRLLSGAGRQGRLAVAVAQWGRDPLQHFEREFGVASVDDVIAEALRRLDGADERKSEVAPGGLERRSRSIDCCLVGDIEGEPVVDGNSAKSAQSAGHDGIPRSGLRATVSESLEGNTDLDGESHIKGDVEPGRLNSDASVDVTPTPRPVARLLSEAELLQRRNEYVSSERVDDLRSRRAGHVDILPDQPSPIAGSRARDPTHEGARACARDPEALDLRHAANWQP